MAKRDREVYESGEIDELLKCPFCSVRYNGVIKIIPGCGESICGECYKDLRLNYGASKMFECKACNGSHLMPRDEFEDNKIVSRFLKKQKRENPLAERLKLLNGQFNEILDELRSLESFQPIEVVNVHCDDLESQVHEACESVVKQVNEIKQDLLKEIGAYRSKCLESCSKRPEPASGQSVDEMANTSLSDEGISDLREECTCLFNELNDSASEDDLNFGLGQAREFRNRLRLVQGQMRMEAFNRRLMVFKPCDGLLENRERIKDFFNLKLKYEKIEVFGIEDTPVRTFEGDSEEVNQAIFATDGRIISCSNDGSIKVWNYNDGTELYELKGHGGAVYCLAMLQNGWLASGSEDESIKIWDLTERKEVKTLRGHTSEVASLQVLKNGNLVSYCLDDTIRVWNPYQAADNLLITMTGHDNSYKILPFSILSNGYLVTASNDGNSNEECIMRVWDPSNAQLVEAVPTGQVEVWTVLALVDDQVALGFANGTIKLIDWTDDSKSRTKQQAHASSVSAFAQLSNGNLLSAGDDKAPDGFCIKMWNLDGFSLLQTVASDHYGVIQSLSLSPDEKLLASASHDLTIKLWAVISAS